MSEIAVWSLLVFGISVVSGFTWWWLPKLWNSYKNKQDQTDKIEHYLHESQDWADKYHREIKVLNAQHEIDIAETIRKYNKNIGNKS